MDSQRPIATEDAVRTDSDEAFLDDAFDRAVARLEGGSAVAAGELIADRPHLRNELEELIRAAEEITGSHASAVPNIAGYTILSELGRGGMGAVYLARQERIGGRLIALKVLPGAAALSARARQRFIAEAEALARLRHPNVVTVHDVVREGPFFAFAMEWVEGASLARLIERRREIQPSPRPSPYEGEGDDPWLRIGAIDAAGVARIGIAMARALEAVHAAGLLHRDVKPSNILMRTDGTPLLSDFGLVRETDSTIHTQAGHFVGTLAYAAPEQLRGEHDKLDARTDVYGLGATLYHALALQLPFAGRTPAELLRQVEGGKAEPLQRVAKRTENALPQDLVTIVSKAMEPEPARRYATAGELADDLERLLNLQPIKAKPATLATRVWKAARRNRASLVSVVLGGVTALALAGAVAMYGLVLPRWAQNSLTQARLALLDPEQGNAIFDAEFFGEPNALISAIRPDGLRIALAHYDSALRWRPFDGEVRREREIVERAMQATKPLSHEATKGMRSEPEAQATGPLQSVVSSLPTDLRSAGLYAFLTGDAAAAIDAWTKLDLQGEPDAFVHAALGQLYIARGEHARAYPRLRQAIDAFPSVSFLTQYLADAAVQCGDLDKAQQWLDLARQQPMQDKHRGRDRIQADLFAALGRDDEAGAIYSAIEFNNPVAQFHHARLLESRGRLEGAVRKYAVVCQRLPHGDRPCRALVAAMDRWWVSRSEAGRREAVRATLDGRQEVPNSLFSLLVVYSAASDRSIKPEPSLNFRRAGVDSALFTEWLGGSVASWLFFATPSRVNSAPYLQGDSVSLKTLAQRMEVTDMSLLNYARTLPTEVKDSLTRVWLTPAYGLKEHILTGAARLGAKLHGAREKAQRHEATEARRELAIRTPSASAGSTSTGSTGPRRSRYGFESCVPSSLRRPVAPSLIAVSWLFAAAATHGQCPSAGFTGLGDLPGGTVSSLLFHHGGLSTDGSTVVGVSESVNGSEAFRWCADTGIVGLGDLPGGAFSSIASDPSSDGEVVAGVGHSANGTEAFRWTSVTGMVGLGDLPGGGFTSVGYSISSDGTTVVGAGTNDLSNTAAYWSTSSGSWTDLGFATGSANSSAIEAVTPSLVWFVGDHRIGGSGSYNAFRWSLGTGEETLGDLPGGATFALAAAISDDGSVVVGAGTSGFGAEGFQWTEASGMVGLGDLSGGAFDSGALGITADGSIIVGFSASSIGSEAVLWDDTLTMHRVANVLASNGVEIPCGWKLTSAKDITINCGVVTIAGDALNHNGNAEGWIASYLPGSDPAPPPDIDGDGFCNAVDNCPTVSNANQADSDADGVGDVCDNCSSIPNTNQVDADADGRGDLCDNCPTVANANQADGDSDGRGNLCDNCPSISNANQLDSESDGVGNVCDNCPNAANTNQADSDADGRGNVCDNCPTASNANQADTDADSVGNVCDNCPTVANTGQTDADGDGRGNSCDNCPTVANFNQADTDADGVGDFCDNCNLANPNQADCNADTIGDVCNIASGASCDANANVIPDECECADADVCTVRRFDGGGVCQTDAIEFGDVDASGLAEIGDVICILAGYGDYCDCPNGDIGGCAPDGLIEIGDVIAMLGAYNGVDPCGCGQ